MVGFSSPFDPPVRDRLLHQLSRAYPHFPPESVEDAVQDALVAVLKRPPAQPGELTPLVYHIAWRVLNGEWRRVKRRPEAPPAVLEQVLRTPPGQEAVLCVRRGERARKRVLDKFGGCHRAALDAALTDKLESGDTDVAVAQRHGLCRERLNRAWRALVAELVPG